MLFAQGGMYVFQLFDYFSASGIILLSICGLEAFVLAWVYGVDRLIENFEMMLGFKLFRYFKYAWKYITPLQTFVSIDYFFLMFPLITPTSET